MIRKVVQIFGINGFVGWSRGFQQESQFLREKPRQALRANAMADLPLNGPAREGIAAIEGFSAPRAHAEEVPWPIHSGQDPL